jgi:putative hydrolase of the HAD superfamily
MTNSSANLISENNFDTVNFINEYDYWIFDLDNTIYDFHLGLFRRISQRMTEYIKSLFNINHDEALSLQKNMYKKYGLTLRGLIIEKNIDPEPFLNYVHDVGFDDLKTNASFHHAKNILKSMGIFEEFEIIFDIKDANYIAKPDFKSYDMMKEKFGLNNNNINRSIFFEDTAKNLKPASELGMGTVWIENDFNRKEADIYQEYIDFTGSDIKTILRNMIKK